MRRFIPLILTLTIAACSRSGSELTRFYEDGRAKPAIAIAPVIDATSIDLPWSLSEELTSLIIESVSQDGRIFVTSKDLASADAPFGPDLSWIKREFSEDQFVVFLEVVEHTFSPEDPAAQAEPFETAMNLNTTIKLRVVDLRASSPKIVLQEQVRNSYFIPKNMIPTDYSLSGWGTNDFPGTPMGQAHKQLVQELALRIHDYIQLAKSR